MAAAAAELAGGGGAASAGGGGSQASGEARYGTRRRTNLQAARAESLSAQAGRERGSRHGGLAGRLAGPGEDGSAADSAGRGSGGKSPRAPPRDRQQRGKAALAFS